MKPRARDKKKSPKSLRRGVKLSNASSLEETTALGSASTHELIGGDSIGTRLDWRASIKPCLPTSAWTSLTSLPCMLKTSPVKLLQRPCDRLQEFRYSD